MFRLMKLLTHRIFLVGLSILIQLAAILTMLLGFNEYYQQFNQICLILSFVIVIYIVGNRSNPSYKIAWIIPIMMFPIFGWLLYLMFGGNRLSKRTRRKMQNMNQVMVQELSSACKADSFVEIAGEDAAIMAGYIEKRANCPLYSNTQTEYFSLGEEQFESIVRELKKAERYIFLEFFIIEPGIMWDTILSILEEKASAGVDVRVLYDDMGCMFTLPRNYPKELKQKGIKCCVFNTMRPVLSVRMNNRDHRKILVIDGKTAYTGGTNLADEYINAKQRFGHWKDSAILLRGEAVWSLTVMFLNMWDFASGTKEDFQLFRPEAESYSAAGYVQPYEDSPLDDEPVGETVYLNLINKAKRYIYITTPYLIIDHTMEYALCSAAKAGVDVRIITPCVPDKRTIFEVTRAHYLPLLEAGVKIYEYTPGFIHAKIFASDDRFATVGTVNMDYRSMFLHFEDGVMLYDSPTVLDIKKDFLQTLEVSQQMSLKESKSVSVGKRILRSFLRVFAPLM